MTLHNPVWLHADSYDAVDFRQAISSLLNPAGGIVGSGDYAVTAPSSGMSVNVAGGQIWIPGTAVANQAQYYMFNDATISVTVPAADATNPRIDLIVAQVLDATAGAASSIGQVIDVAGTPAASPVAPATPASSIVLAQVAVAAGVTSIVAGDITDERALVGTPGDLVGLAGGITPSYMAWNVGTVGPYANATNNAYTVGSFTLVRPCYLRFAATGSAQWPGNQSISIAIYLDGNPVGNTVPAEGYNSASGNYNIAPFACQGVAGTAAAAAGTHSVEMQFNVGGGGASVTIDGLFAEVQVVG